jgi:rhamnosyltransferase
VSTSADARRSRPVAVMVTFNPPEGLGGRVRATLHQSAAVVIVDNGSTTALDLSDLDAEDRARVHVLPKGQNIGLAAALNLGVEQAAQMGATWVLLLDHDSQPQPDMVRHLRQAIDSHDPRHPVAVAVPRIAYAHPDIRCRWPASARGQRFWFRFVYAARMSAPQPVDLAIGSGMLLNVDAWRRVGKFDAALFIDLVDTEFCLRARTFGLDVLAVPGAVLTHALGDVAKRRLLGRPVFPTHHSAFRHYYLSRNRVVLTRRFGLRYPNWLFYETMSALKLIIKVALYEPQRAEKLASMWRGTADGVRMALSERSPRAPTHQAG